MPVELGVVALVCDRHAEGQPTAYSVFGKLPVQETASHCSTHSLRAILARRCTRFVELGQAGVRLAERLRGGGSRSDPLWKLFDDGGTRVPLIQEDNTGIVPTVANRPANALSTAQRDAIVTVSSSTNLVNGTHAQSLEVSLAGTLPVCLIHIRHTLAKLGIIRIRIRHADDHDKLRRSGQQRALPSIARGDAGHVHERGRPRS